MRLSESDTRTKLIDPALHARGWTENLIRSEETAGAIEIVDGKACRFEITERSKKEAEADRQITADNLKQFGEPVYEYDIARGIEDGYLAACEVHRTDLFLDDKRETEGIDREDLEGKTLTDVTTGQRLSLAEARAHYGASDLEEKLLLPERVAAMCGELFRRLCETSGPEQKTIMFCARDRHGEPYADVKSIQEEMGRRYAPFYLRRTKEAMVYFHERRADGTWVARKIFTKRFPHTVGFQIDGLEFDLYREVIRFVKHQSAKAAAQGDDPRARAVGFLMSLYQCRLASNTYAIRHCLKNRARRLEQGLQCAKKRVSCPRPWLVSSVRLQRTPASRLRPSTICRVSSGQAEHRSCRPSITTSRIEGYRVWRFLTPLLYIARDGERTTWGGSCQILIA